MKYQAKWSVNNSTYGLLENDNLAQLKADCAKIVKGNTFADSRGSYSIYNGEEFICGSVYRANGFPQWIPTEW